jgi:uncharacterized protein YaaN involved in tellurite resistance
MSKSVRAVAAPPADASRVAAIRNSLNPTDASAVAAFGERARREVTASVERLAAEVRTRDLPDMTDALHRAAETVRGLEPEMLTPTGMASLFGGRQRRLGWFRGRYEAASRALEDLTAEAKDRAQRIEAKTHALNTLHEQARTFILELDAYLEAGRTRVAEAAAESADALSHRLGELDALRNTAVQQLPLVRVVQNIDAPVGETLTSAFAAMDQWRADWADRLGMHMDPRARLRPDEAALAEDKAKLIKALETTATAVAEAHTRRRAAEEELAQAAKALGARG